MSLVSAVNMKDLGNLWIKIQPSTSVESSNVNSIFW